MRARIHTSDPRRGGTTYLEVVIGLAMVASLVLAGLGVEQSALKGIRATERSAQVSERAARLAGRIDRELRLASLGTLRVPGPLGLQAPVNLTTYQDELRFKRVINFGTGGIVTSPETTLRRTLDPGENSNGVDDDGDGLVDEGTLLLATAGGVSATIATGVTSFSIRLQGKSLTVTVSAGIGGPGGDARTESVVRTVTLRSD